MDHHLLYLCLCVARLHGRMVCSTIRRRNEKKEEENVVWFMIIGRTIIVASLQFTLDYALMIEIRVIYSDSHATYLLHVIHGECAIA